MKRLTFAAGLFASVACFCLQAQSNDLLANIPFDFRMGDVVMPAGDYRIYQASSGLVTLRKQDGAPKAAAFLTLPDSRGKSSDQGALEFNRYGDTYFLSHVWAPNSHEGRTLPKSAVEKELISRAGQVQTAGITLRRK
jgi:hypothetical protein